MKYQPPVGGDAGDPYVDFNAVTGESGSIPPAVAIEAPQRELDHLITSAGLTPDEEDNTQVAQAIQQMIKASKDGIVYEDVTFGAGVADGEPVRLDTGAGEYVKAVADGTANNQAVGFADVTNSRVYAFGLTRPDLFSGLTPGTMYYLDEATPGAITDTPPDDAVKLGIAVSATQMDVDVDTGQAVAVVADMPFIMGWEQGVGNLDLEVAEYFSFIPAACRLTAALGAGAGVIGEAPEGAAVEVDVLKNGVSVFATRPSWAATTGALTAGALTGTITFNGTTDIMSVEIAQIGSMAAGRKLHYTLLAERI